MTPNQSWPALNMSRVFGDLHAHGQGATWLPEVRLLDAQPGDILVLATDGIWDVFTDETELMPFLFGGANNSIATSPNDTSENNKTNSKWTVVADSITKEAKKRWNEQLDDGFHDDITCIVMAL